MEVSKLVLEFIKVLIWPVVASISLLLFQAELRALARSLKKVRLPGGTELDLQQQVNEIEKAAEKVEALPKSKALIENAQQLNEFSRQISSFDLLTSPSNYDFGYYKKIAESDPNLALAGLRMELERMLQNMARISNIKFDDRRTSPGRFSGQLRAQGLLEDEEYELLRTVIEIANAALHGRNVSVADAVRTIQSSEAFLDTYIPFMSGAMDRHHAERANNAMQATR